MADSEIDQCTGTDFRSANDQACNQLCTLALNLRKRLYAVGSSKVPFSCIVSINPRTCNDEPRTMNLHATMGLNNRDTCAEPQESTVTIRSHVRLLPIAMPTLLLLVASSILEGEVSINSA